MGKRTRGNGGARGFLPEIKSSAPNGHGGGAHRSHLNSGIYYIRGMSQSFLCLLIKSAYFKSIGWNEMSQEEAGMQMGKGPSWP